MRTIRQKATSTTVSASEQKLSISLRCFLQFAANTFFITNISFFFYFSSLFVDPKIFGMTWNFVLLFFLSCLHQLTILHERTCDFASLFVFICNASSKYFSYIKLIEGNFFIVTSKHEKWNKRISVCDGIAICGSRIMRNYQHFIKVLLRTKLNRNQINPNRTRSMQSLIEKATGSSTGIETICNYSSLETIYAIISENSIHY